ncbi:hypothetical protein [Bradyrhizobium sp. CCBAU 51627]|uniref:hypothetical protein n=1 Tax=Bradyrhizobium sp. CCBAU 51627 TaxID=1325088 RepID=UPI003FA425EF
MPSITAGGLVVLVVISAALTVQMIRRRRRSGQTIFNGGILLGLALSIACALPLLSHLSWAEFLDEALDQGVAAIRFLEATYLILTL